MELIDKAKETATRFAEQAKDKLDEVNKRRKADGLLAELGRIVYRQRTTGTGSDDPNDELEIQRLVRELQSLDAAAADAGTPASGDAQEASEAQFVAEAPPPGDV